MRALLTTQPGTGHLQALVPVALALVEAGHDVAVCSSPSLRAEVEAFGWRHFDAGPPWHMSWPLNARPWADQVRGVALDFVSGMVSWVEVLARSILPDVLTVARDWRPDVIIRESTEFAGCTAAERLGIPHASVLAVVLSPDQLRSGAVAAALDDLRAEVGLPATGGAHMAYRYLHLCLMAPRFFHDTEEQCATAHFLRYQARARPGDSISRQFMGLPDHPMVLVSLGTTAFSDNRRIWDALLEGLAGERLNLVLGMGAGPDPESFGPLPPNVLIQRYVPQALLLPRCAAMITNGGFNSVRDALSLGVPLVLIPLAACQPTTAARCAALGLGRVVRPFEATPATIAEAVRAVLDEPVYSSNARAFADELAALPGREEMVGLLEMLAREAKPLVRRS